MDDEAQAAAASTEAETAERVNVLAARQIQPFSVTDLVLGSIMSASGVLLNADKALRENPSLARMMRYDPDIVTEITQRQTAVAESPWLLVPEDPKDPQQLAECAALTSAFLRMRNFRGLLDGLALGFWYGTTGSQLRYAYLSRPVIGRDPDGKREAKAVVAPSSFMPLPPDSLLFRDDGALYVRVSAFSGWRRQPLEGRQWEHSPEGPVTRVTEAEREAIVLNTWGISAPEWDEASSAQAVFKGYGMRSWLWYGWLNKQHITQNRAHYLERLARGMVVGYYTGGEPGRQAMVDILNSMAKAWAVTCPRQVGEKDDPLQILEPSGTGYQIFADHLNMERSSLRRAIVGQELTSEARPTGLGSNLADIHQDTFTTLIKRDARVLGESVTAEIVRPMQAANFPNGTGAHHRFTYAMLEDDETREAMMANVEKYVNMGGEVPVSWFRDKFGFPQPQDGEPVIGAQQPEADHAAELIGKMGGV